MTWFVFAFLTAFSESMKDVFSKKSLKNIDEYIVSWALRLFALPFLLPLVFIIEVPAFGRQFLIALFVSGSLNVLTTILYMKAIKYSDLSISVPMVTFTPLFLLLTSPLLVGEFPTPYGLAGVVLIVTGSYTLNLKERSKGYLDPFKALISEKGPKLMLIVAFLWSITSNIDKLGVQDSSPIFWAIAVNVYISAVMFPFMIYKSRKNLNQIPLYAKALLPIGLFTALTVIFQMTALNLTLVAYVISIKRTSVIMSVFFGFLLFKEKGIKERLFGSVLMIAGVILITVYS